MAPAVGRPERGEALLAGLCPAGRVRRQAAGARRPSLLTIEWIDPVMIGATWMPELPAALGQAPEALVTRPGDRAPTLGLEALAALAPEVLPDQALRLQARGDARGGRR